VAFAMKLTHKYSRSLTLIGLVCAVSGAFFIGRTLGASSQAASISRIREQFKLPALSDAKLPDPQPAPSLASFSNTSNGSTAQESTSSVPPADIYEEALTNVRRNFVEINEFPLSKLDVDGIGRMYATLGDPRTHALTIERCKAREDALEGRFAGIGAVLSITHSHRADVDYSHLTVVDVMPDSPAEKAGLRSGDWITEIDGRWVINYTIYADANRIGRDKSLDDGSRQQQVDQVNHKFRTGLSLSHALDSLETGDGKPLALTIERPAPNGQNLPAIPLKVTLTTAVTEVPPATFRLLGTKGGRKLGYLRIRLFNARATAIFTKALSSLSDAGAVGGLIVDLRQSPGGVTSDSDSALDGFASARHLISLLTSGGTVARIEHRPAHRDALVINPASSVLHCKMVVLVDGGTANLAELTASALKDAGKARLLGTHTFGDDVLTMFAHFKSGIGVELTTGHLFTASGIDLARGLEPDIVWDNANDNTIKADNEEALLARAGSILDL